MAWNCFCGGGGKTKAKAPKYNKKKKSNNKKGRLVISAPIIEVSHNLIIPYPEIIDKQRSAFNRKEKFLVRWKLLPNDVWRRITCVHAYYMFGILTWWSRRRTFLMSRSGVIIKLYAPIVERFSRCSPGQAGSQRSHEAMAIVVVC